MSVATNNFKIKIVCAAILAANFSGVFPATSAAQSSAAATPNLRRDASKLEPRHAAAAQQPQPDVSTGEIPIAADLQILLRTTVQAFAAAVKTTDFAAFHQNAAPYYKRVLAVRHAEFYQNMPDWYVPKLEWTAQQTAQFSQPPAIRKFKWTKADKDKTKNKIEVFSALDLLGSYEDETRKIKFYVQYHRVGTEWKVSVIELFRQ